MNDIDSSGLMPCPFDGGKAKAYFIDDNSYSKTVVVACDDCTARVETCEVWSLREGMDTFLLKCKVVAEEAWNRRA